MARILVLPLLIAFSCLLAGVFGAAHNQVSYTIGPDYFHHLKFDQFGIEDYLRDRFGAAIVGWFASWWMGLIIGVPIGLMSLLMPNLGGQIRAFVTAAGLVIGVTALLGMSTLLMDPPAEARDLIRIPASAADETGFLRAAILHNMTYLGGLVGAVLGMITMAIMVWRARRRAA